VAGGSTGAGCRKHRRVPGAEQYVGQHSGFEASAGLVKHPGIGQTGLKSRPF